MAKFKNQKHIVMFPFMAQGHIIPFLALARRLEQGQSYIITLVNTPLNIKKLKSSLPRKTNIRLEELPYSGTDFGLPPNIESTDQISSSLEFFSFCEASKLLEKPFKDLIMEIMEHDDVAPLCIIGDMFLGWTVNVARELGIFSSVFVAGTGYSMGLYFSISLNNSFWKLEGEELDFLVPDFPEAEKIKKSRLGRDLKYRDSSNIIFQFRKEQFSFCLLADSILLNTMEGLDFHGEEYFRRKTGGKPVFSIGPISPSMEINDDLENKRGEKITQWLDLQEPNSVLYISFGSQNRISLEQMMELAMGLEASGKAFIWVARPPIEYSSREKFRDEWLPKGFSDRIKSDNKGILVHEWAPQKEILSHESIGGFVSHCGWNSVLESLGKGVPIIGWPLLAEQFFNSHILEKEVGVCLELGRGNESRVVKKDRICKVIKTMMDKTEKGEKIRRRTDEIREKMENAVGFQGSSFKTLDEFICTAISKTKRLM